MEMKSNLFINGTVTSAISSMKMYKFYNNKKTLFELSLQNDQNVCKQIKIIFIYKMNKEEQQLSSFFPF